MIKILKYNEVDKKDIFARTAPTVDVEDIVADIIYDVRKNGDKALFKYCEKFDKAKLSDLAVSSQEIGEAVNATDPEFLRILKRGMIRIV